MMKGVPHNMHLADAKESSKRLIVPFPGVHGRMTQLAKVVESRYQLAMAVVLGRDIDSVRIHAQCSISMSNGEAND